MHVDRSVHQQNISMPYTANEQDTEPLQIVTGCEAIEYLNVTIVARSTPEMEDPERFFKTVTFKTHRYNY